MVTRKHPLAKCEECVFQNAPFVPTQNPQPRSKLAVVGEAPGAYEAGRGIPFTGPSGRLLDQVLAHHNYQRSEVMITNVCLCRPTDNADPPKSAIAACKPRLDAELAASGIDKILAVGGTAASALIDPKKKISSLRVGPPKPYIENPEIKVVASWHPAYCLRAPDAFPSFVSDIGKLAGKIYETWTEPDYRVFTDGSTILEVLRRLDGLTGPVVVDIECGVDKDFAYVHPDQYDLLCVGIAYAPRKAVVIAGSGLKEAAVQDAFGRYLAGKRIIAHNGKFDLAALRPAFNRDLALWADTMLMSYCLAPETKVLKRDLTWDKIENLLPGDDLVGFDEDDIMNMKPTKVLATNRLIAPCYEIVTDHGTVVCSENHMWPVTRHGTAARRWLSTKTILSRMNKGAGYFLSHFVKPWEVLNSYEAGYLSGIIDGEGCLARQGGPSNAHYNNYVLQFTQKPGHVLDQSLAFLKQLGFNTYEYKYRYDLCVDVKFASKFSRETLRVLGSLRPARFMQDTDKLWAGRRRTRLVKILSINYIGEREVIGIETDTRTLVAEGFLTHNCLDERPGQHGLKKLGIEILGTPDWEAAIRRYVPRGGNYADIPRHILYRYNAFDVGVTWDLWELFTSRMGDRERQQHEFLIQASNALMNLEAAGITFDVPYSFELQTLLEDELGDLELAIERTTGRALNPRSPMQIQRWFAERGFMLKTTQADVLEKVLEKATIPQDIHKFIEQLLLHRRRTKLNGTYVKGFQKRIHDGKVYTTYTLHGTTSGRLASKNPNMQNIVRDKRIKHQFTVEHEDNVLIQLDYKQAEGRVITTLARDEYLASIFKDSSRDIFDELTTQIYGEDNWSKEERVKIKSVFYGLSYGRGAESIGVELGISTNEAKELLANFKALIPATVSWQASVTHRVLSGEDLLTPFGRKRSFWLITEQNKADVVNEALSFLPQSIASDICLTALIRLQPQLKGLATTRLTIHDAMIVECKEVDADEVTAIMTDAMVKSGEAFTDFVPFVVDASRGKRWSDL